MKTMIGVLGTLLVLCSLGLAQTKGEKQTISAVLDGNLKIAEGDFVNAAEAMPEEKYSFAPTNGEFKGVRTFAEQVKHVAASNEMIASHILGEKPPVDANGGKGPDSVKSKADILKYLDDSFTYAHKAIASITDANALEAIPSSTEGETTRMRLGMILAWHTFDHYGQMVIYMRMNGIVPPASQR